MIPVHPFSRHDREWCSIWCPLSSAQHHSAILWRLFIHYSLQIVEIVQSVYRPSEKVPRFAANGGGRSALDGRSLTLEAPGGVMHTFNNSTPIQSRHYQTNTKNYFDTFALAYFFALFNSTKISQLIRQYFTFGSFINYERLEESPARKEKSRFSWL